MRSKNRTLKFLYCTVLFFLFWCVVSIIFVANISKLNTLFKYFDFFFLSLQNKIMIRTQTIRRVTNTMKRIVAYNYKYKCARCKIMLPPTWECDHVVPLWKFVQQTRYSQDPNDFLNLQPLCPNCHKKKTMRETLEREQIRPTFIECPHCQIRYSPYFSHDCWLFPCA